MGFKIAHILIASNLSRPLLKTIIPYVLLSPWLECSWNKLQQFYKKNVSDTAQAFIEIRNHIDIIIICIIIYIHAYFATYVIIMAYWPEGCPGRRLDREVAGNAIFFLLASCWQELRKTDDIIGIDSFVAKVWRNVRGQYQFKTTEVTSYLSAAMFFGGIDLYSVHWVHGANRNLASSQS